MLLRLHRPTFTCFFTVVGLQGAAYLQARQVLELEWRPDGAPVILFKRSRQATPEKRSGTKLELYDAQPCKLIALLTFIARQADLASDSVGCAATPSRVRLA